jgi:dihydroorotate dehydrogenase
MYQYIIKPLLFLFPPEKAHHISITILNAFLIFPFGKNLIRNLFFIENDSLRFTKKNITFPNRVGLAAGFDKNGSFYRSFQHFGFGFFELGTVTPIAQPGNPKPRLFRLPKDEALINRMGFNNEGVDALVDRLKNRPPSLVIGGNIGRNKNTSEENAIEDYLICFRKLYNYVDYFAINVSSPNTPGLRNLQDKEPLTNLLNALKKEASTFSVSRPILLKIAPDLTKEAIVEIVEVIKETGIDGVIATNTTISREHLNTSSTEINTIGAGGLSGKPLTKKSTEIISQLRNLLGNSYLIMGVGGIHSATDAKEKLAAGADVVQLYTGFIYEGPSLVKKINKKLLKRKV